jgi:DNA-binding NarL/FixJ family response regulator
VTTLNKPYLTRRQREWAYDRWCEGYTPLEIAGALYVCERTVQKALRGKDKVRPPLHYDFKEENK